MAATINNNKSAMHATVHINRSPSTTNRDNHSSVMAMAHHGASTPKRR